MMRNSIKWFGPPVALVIVATGIGMFRGARAQQAFDEIDIPRQWVPFTADVTKLAPGAPAVLGRFYRDRNGSERLETGPSRDQTEVIGIKNIPQLKHYLFTKVRGWEMNPMTVAMNYKPPRVRLPSRSYAKYTYRLALGAGQNGSLQSRDGFEAYQHVSPEGDLDLFIPALNFFEAVRNGVAGDSIVFSNIQLTRHSPTVLHYGVTYHRQERSSAHIAATWSTIFSLTTTGGASESTLPAWPGSVGSTREKRQKARASFCVGTWTNNTASRFDLAALIVNALWLGFGPQAVK